VGLRRALTPVLVGRTGPLAGCKVTSPGRVLAVAQRRPAAGPDERIRRGVAIGSHALAHARPNVGPLWAHARELGRLAPPVQVRWPRSGPTRARKGLAEQNAPSKLETTDGISCRWTPHLRGFGRFLEAATAGNPPDFCAPPPTVPQGFAHFAPHAFMESLCE
jgi:hypothetical protein